MLLENRAFLKVAPFLLSVCLVVRAPAGAQIEVAGDLFVELDAGHPSAGSPMWFNTASDSIGDFFEVGDPFFEEIEGMPAVTFNTTDVQDAYQSFESPPAGLVGPDATRSIEVWVYNTQIPTEETILSWGHRGGPDGTNMSFNYGTDGRWGAVGHWGGAGPDLGWNDAGGAPDPNEWHHLVYTYDGQTTRVYADGCVIDEDNCETNSELLGEGAIDTHGTPPITLASQIESDGITLNFGLRGSLSLGRVRIHDGALTPAQIQNNYDLECLEFCPQPTLCACENCPEGGDSLFRGSVAYIRKIRFSCFPDATGLAVLAPPDATLEADGRLTYVIPNPEPDSFTVTVEATNDEGTATFTWEVTLVDPPARGDIEVAEELLVELFASHASAGAAVWLNSGTLADFDRIGEPAATILGPEDSPAVMFNDTVSDDAYQCLEDAPLGVVGPDPTRSIEVWAYNPDIVGEETLVAWGQRGGPCGSNMSFNYGTDPYFGAVGHWCHDPGPDIGWINPGEVGLEEPPFAGEWHHLVYTYDGQTTRVYADGLLANSEVVGAGVINTWDGHPITLAAQLFAAGNLDFGAGREGTLALGQVRVHDGVLTIDQIRNNFELEREAYGVGPIPAEAPAFLDAPPDDTILSGTPTYTRILTITGFPTPDLEVLAPVDGTISEAGVFSYDLSFPEPDGFTVTIKATNDGGEAQATWDVTVIKAEVLSLPPVHRYSFSENAEDSIGGAHGVPYGDVSFEGGQAVLLNDGLQNSNDAGQFPDPLNQEKLPPGAYIDLPDGIISALGQDGDGLPITAQATFEVWTTWDGVVDTSWQRIFDLGTSVGGEGWSDGAAPRSNLFLTPRSGDNTLRFGYRPTVVFGVSEERNVNGPRLVEGVEQHVVVVWDEVELTATIYVNGNRVDQNSLHFGLGELDDVNNWLGRSQWADAMFDGSYNEFRIYDYPLTQEQVVGNFQAGPDTVNVGVEVEICDDDEDNDGDTLVDCDDPDCELTPDCEPGGFIRGDTNADGSRNITDGVFVFSFLFTGGAEPPCKDAADTSDQGSINITSGIYILNFLFLGGPEPPAPFPDCGTDPTPEATELGCLSFPPCEP